MFLSILSFVAFLSVLVLVHELGHFIAARRAGIWVEEFGFGIPPKLFGIKKGETIYSVNLFPFGGFVRLHGEDDNGQITNPDRAFVNKSWGARMLIVCAGVIMNILLAIASFSVVYTVSGIPTNVETGRVEVNGISKDSPADYSGFEVGDVIKKVGGVAISFADELTLEISKSKGREIALLIERSGEEKVITVTPRENPPSGEGSLGVSVSSTVFESYYPPIWQRPFYGIWHGLKEAFFWGSVIVIGLFQLLWNLVRGTVPTDLVGPTGLYAVTTEVSKQGMVALINWMGIISVNLAVLNIFPFPALDGGRAAFLVAEKIFGRKVKPRIEGWFHTIGLVLLISLIVLVTFREVSLIAKHGLSGYIEVITKGQGL